MGVPISNVTRRVVYAASGTGPYNFTFEILAAGDIAVYRDDTLLTLTTNYTVTINSNGTGFVTLTATPTGATQIAIVGNRTISRTTDFVTGGDFFANTLNDELDQQTIFNQQNAEGLQRALIAPQTDPTTIDMTLPRAVDRANKTLAFDANGDPTLGISAADVANAVTYATNAANSATAAASSASAASSSASSASSSASTATTQASNASTSATNAANSASAASTSATNAASSASTATTQASNASTSATNAASSASAASTSASNAATSATNASNSASSASTSATNASNSATAAANSATAAAASASAAANTFDSFDDRYLGTKASNPTLDNDGNALVAGALYFSTSENIMKVYDGASWIAATSAGNVSFLRFRYVATSGQTTFSGSDSNAATLSYTVNNIVVFLNGVSLDQTEYTATSGTSVVLGAGAALNDELVIVAFKSFVTADMVPASTGGTYAGAVRFAAGSASVPSISVSGDTNTGIFYPAADTVAIGTGGTERLRVDSAGNAGLGATPNAWGASWKSMSFNTVGAVASTTGVTRLYHNAFNNDSNNLYRTTAAASMYSQDGAHAWFIAPSGTAGNAITFTQAMTLDASGWLGLGSGATSPAAPLHISNSQNEIMRLQTSDSTTGAIFFTFHDSASARKGYIGYGSGANDNLEFYNDEAAPITFSTNGTERMIVRGYLNTAAASEVGIGESNPQAILHIKGPSYSPQFVIERSGTATGRYSIDVGDNSFKLQDDAAGSAIRLRITSSGGLTCAGVYSTIVGGTNRDVFVDNGGVIGYVSSTRASKTNIQDLTDTSWLHQLNPVSFNYRKKDEEGSYTDETDGDIQYGLIAEDVEQVRPDLCFYDEVDGEQELRGIQYSKLVPVMLKEIQKLRAELNALKGNA